MLEDSRLKIFMTVAQEGSFTKAAAVLGISQPAVSQNIAELEKSTGVKLFDRLRSEVVLTDQGQVFMDYAQKIIAGYASMSGMFTKLSPQTVRISVSEELYTYLISPLLVSFTKIHNDITFERVMFDNADLIISLAPSPDSPFDLYPDTIAKLRTALSAAPKKMGDISATHEKLSYFDILYKPSAAFACTKVCRVLKDYFASLL